jgi:hypothetical protein
LPVPYRGESDDLLIAKLFRPFINQLEDGADIMGVRLILTLRMACRGH